jgi:hypothetical protein
MMPTFPSSPLRFRTAGFLRYGSKAGLSDRAFPKHASVKLAPSIPVTWYRFASVLRALRGSIYPRSKSGAAARCNTAILQGPSLRSGLCCPGPSPLNRPHPSHSQAHRNFIALRLICDAFAVRERLGDPRVVPGFRCSFFPDMPSPKTPRSSDIRKFQNRDVDVGLHQRNSGSALPMFPQSVSRGWNNFEASTVRPFATVCQVARRPVWIWPVSWPTAPFTSRLSAARSPSPLLDMTTASTGLLCWRDFHPLE